MKKLFLLVVTVVFAFSLNAQKIGVKAGYGMSGYNTNYYITDGNAMNMGFHAGLVAELDLKIIGVRADVTFQQLGKKYDSDNDSDEDNPTKDAIHLVQNQKVNYLNVGVSVMKGFGPAYLTIGPYFGYALSGNVKNTLDIEGFDQQEWETDLFSDPNDDFNPLELRSDDNNPGGPGADFINKLDIGAKLGVGANFSSIFVEGSIGYGFLSIINLDSDSYSQDNYTKKDAKTEALGEDAKANNLFFGLSVGYMFGF